MRTFGSVLALGFACLASSACGGRQPALTAPPPSAPPGELSAAPAPVLVEAVPSAESLAFPGAVGWARTTPGGRGGKIVRVTTLAPAGPGSLTAGLAMDGPRIVVFEVGGIIDLNLVTVDVERPFLTVAGQTAPSPGITLIRGGIRIKTHDVVLQHIRVRPGEAGQPKKGGWEIDGITTSTGARDVVIDHCSTSWATDENLTASGSRFSGDTPAAWRAATSHRVTLSNNLVGECLSNSSHKKGEHSKGTLIHDNATDIAVIGNLFISNVERNPFFKGGARGIVVNNFIANPKIYAMKYTLVKHEWGDRPPQVGQMAIVGNVFVYGPDTRDDVPLVFASGVGQVEIYLSDNVAKDRKGGDVPQLGGETKLLVTMDQPPLWPAGLTAMPSSAVREHVRLEVGARPWDRDAVDKRLVEQALSGGGKIIDSETEVGGYPVVSPTRAPFVDADWDLRTMTRKPAGR
jgi:pectate lyase